MTPRLRLFVVVTAVTVLAACGGEDASSSDTHSSGMHGTNGSMMDFGSPGDPADANRSIEIEAQDSLQFDPDSVEVESGEVVTFVVTNSGSNDHEFVLGDEAFQAEHEAPMDEGDVHHGGGMAIEIAPGETSEITWEFPTSGTILYGCHEPGHYDGGMVGTVVVG